MKLLETNQSWLDGLSGTATASRISTVWFSQGRAVCPPWGRKGALGSPPCSASIPSTGTLRDTAQGNGCPLHLCSDLLVAMGKVLNSSVCCFFPFFFLINIMMFNFYGHIEELSFATSGHEDTYDFHSHALNIGPLPLGPLLPFP